MRQDTTTLPTQEPSDLFEGAYFDNPYPTLSRLRETSPVHRFTFPLADAPVWIVTRYDHVRSVLSDPRFSVDGSAWASAEFRRAGLVVGEGTLFSQVISLVDPPDHTRIRRLAQGAFTPARVERWRPKVRQAVQAQVDRLRRKLAAEGRAELLEDFAWPIPMQVISEVLGVALDGIEDMADIVARIYPTDPALAPGIPRAFNDLAAFSRQLVVQKSRALTEDLTSDLIRAHVDGQRLDEEELAALVLLLAIGGIETTRGLIANAVVALSEFPDQVDGATAAPTLPPVATEEFLRHSGSAANLMIRFATEDIELAGRTIPTGGAVLPCVLSGNRDPRRFSRPDVLDLSRKEAKHLGLGHGIHNCLGAALARLEFSEAVPALYRALPDLRPAVPREELVYVPNWVVRMPQTLPVTTGAPPT
ncbi:cytochrome P450 [Streptomyces sp. NPDC047097]|uniref:cytochrome P450 n=1 Tax=Streptomyces sp. NPDC047097 TaxID=3155260 RepID=UPI0033ED9C57